MLRPTGHAGFGFPWKLKSVSSPMLSTAWKISARVISPRARDVSAALPAACNADESRSAQLPEDAANDDGMRTDAAREAFARGGLLLSVELDGDEDVDGDGEAA